MRTIAEKLFEKIANDAIEYGYREEARKMAEEPQKTAFFALAPFDTSKNKHNTTKNYAKGYYNRIIGSLQKH